MFIPNLTFKYYCTIAALTYCNMLRALLLVLFNLRIGIKQIFLSLIVLLSAVGVAKSDDLVVNYVGNSRGKASWKGKTYDCFVGENGVVDGDKRKENNAKTPRGSYDILMLMYRPDRVKELVPSNLPIKKITRDSAWCRDRKSKFYNTLVSKKDKLNASTLYLNEDWFDVVVVIDFNMPNGHLGERKIIKPEIGKGLGILVHIKDRPTKGCVAFSKKDLLEIISTMKKGDKVIIK